MALRTLKETTMSSILNSTFTFLPKFVMMEPDISEVLRVRGKLDIQAQPQCQPSPGVYKSFLWGGPQTNFYEECMICKVTGRLKNKIKLQKETKRLKCTSFSAALRGGGGGGVYGGGESLEESAVSRLSR